MKKSFFVLVCAAVVFVISLAAIPNVPDKVPDDCKRATFECPGGGYGVHCVSDGAGYVCSPCGEILTPC